MGAAGLLTLHRGMQGGLGDVEHVRQFQSGDQLSVERHGLVVELTRASRCCNSASWSMPLANESPERKIPALSSMVDCISSRMSAIRRDYLPRSDSPSRRTSSSAWRITTGDGCWRWWRISAAALPARAPKTRALRQRAGTQPVRAIDRHVRGLSGREQPVDRGRTIDVGVHPAHHVAHDRADRDEFFDRIDAALVLR